MSTIPTNLLDEMEMAEAAEGAASESKPETESERQKYDRFMRNERHDREAGAADPETGWRYEFWDIGMVRNAKPEDKKRTKVFIDPIPHVVLDQNVPLRGWYENKHQPSPRQRPRPCFTEAVLTQPYGGTCSVGCGFCYINSGVRGYRGQGVTVVDPAYPDKVAKQLAKMRTSAAFYMSSFIDPFLELEPHYQNTYRTATHVLNAGLPMFFLTRKIAPDWVYDYLRANPHSYMQFSINTPDPKDWKLLSPFAASLSEMIEQVRAFHRAGVYISIQVNPIVAGVTSPEQIVELIHILAEAGANHLIFKHVEMSYHSAAALVDVMRRRFGARADRLEALFTQNIGGMKTIEEAYRKKSLDLFAQETEKAGVTMALCYEYEWERDSSGEVVSKTGKSMGLKYLTGDQCHGHRVPLYSRRTTEDAWKALDVCPPQGCLTCGDAAGETSVPCENPRLGAAPALTKADLAEVADRRGLTETGGN